MKGNLLGVTTVVNQDKSKLTIIDFKEKIQQFLKHNQVYPDKRQKYKVWVRKQDMYCNVAYTADTPYSRSVDTKRYFDSGCSRYMTEIQRNLDKFEDVTAGKVTFGGGAKGKIKGKGDTCGPHNHT